MKTIGHKETPIREMIDRAMEKIMVPSMGLSMVVDEDDQLRGFFAGPLTSGVSAALAGATALVSTSASTCTTALARTTATAGATAHSATLSSAAPA